MLQITNLACVNNLTGNYIYTCEKSAEKFEKITYTAHRTKTKGWKRKKQANTKQTKKQEHDRTKPK